MDFQYGASARSYPSLGGDFGAEIGYTQVVWGDHGSSPFYGLIRASLEGSTSGVVNYTDSQITLYPISFLGFGVGHKENDIGYEEFSYYDCSSLRCSGNLVKEYSFSKIAYGYGNILTTFKYTEYRNTYNDETGASKDVAEYEYILAVNPKKEKQAQRSYFLGYKLGEDMVGIASDQHQFLISEKDYQINLAIYQMKIDEFKILVGIGSLQSSDQKPGATVVFKFTQTLAPSFALF